MRGALQNRLSRPLCGVLTTAVVLLSLAVGAWAAGEDGYSHVWQAQGAITGDRGSTVQSVLQSEMTLGRDGESFTGAVTYRDLLGVDSGSGPRSQEAMIELVLSGALLEGGTRAGGTFDGVAVLTDRSADSLEAAVADTVPALSSGVQTRVRVRGHWGANLSGDRATGEILYESVVLEQGPGTGVDAQFFNRVSESGPSGPGDPQTFEVVLAASGTTPDEPDSPVAGGSGEPAEGGDARSGNASSGLTPGQIWNYILRGLTGSRDRRPIGMPPVLTDPARSLAQATPAGARELPAGSIAIDRDVSGAYLDEKNRAAGVLDEVGAQQAAGDVEAMRSLAPGIPAPPPGEAAQSYADRILAALDGLADGETELREELRILAEAPLPPDPTQVLELRTLAFAAEAVRDAGAYGSVLGVTAEQAQRVADKRIEPGPAADAVLASALDPMAPRDAREVAQFEWSAADDIEGGLAKRPSQAAETVSGLLGDSGPVVSWEGDGGEMLTAPGDLSAYRRAEGTLFWTAAPIEGFALRDATLGGWAFSTARVAVVEAAHVGRWVAVFPASGVR